MSGGGLGALVGRVTLVVALAGCAGCERESVGGRPAATTSSSVTAETSATTAPNGLEVTGAIAFVSERHGDEEIYLVEPATGATRRLTERPMRDFLGPPSPTGEHLLIVSAEDRPGGLHREQVWLLDLATTELRTIGPASSMVRHPVWRPDGAAVVVESNEKGFRDLFMVPLEGEARRITDVPEGCFEPDVHPDGGELVYVSSREGNADLYRQALEGEALAGEPRRLTWSRRDDNAPRYSPDGRHIAWTSVRDGRAVVFVMKADGSEPRPVAPPEAGQGSQEAPTWSPGGEAIAFTQRHEDGRVSVVVVRVADGGVVFDSQPAPRADGKAVVDEMPALSPDGRALAFASDRDGDVEIYAASLESGAGPVRLTRSAGPDWLPRWVPASPSSTGSAR